MQIKIINNSGNPLPGYATVGSGGMDVRAFLRKAITIPPGERTLIPTGLHIELPGGCEAQIRPRSGLAVKKGITLLNTPGTIDSDYRGEIKIIVINLSHSPQVIEPGERIAQMVVAKYEKVEWREAAEISATGRGAGGFGHTGK